MTFLVIPALDLKDGKCVQLIGGDPSKKLIEMDNPVEVARDWETRGAERLHLIDLTGTIDGNDVNRPIVEEIIETLHIPVQFGGGMRTVGDAMHYLDHGAERVILGTMAVKEPDNLRVLAEKYGRERITVALDSKGGFVTIKGWQETTRHRAKEMAAGLEEYASECLFTNVDVEGKMEGIAYDIIQEVIDSTSMGIIVSGGITSLDDIRASQEMGAAGVVIGSALYTDRIVFEEAIK